MRYARPTLDPSNPHPEREVLSRIRAVRIIFENFLDKNWFSEMIEELPMDSTTLREIKALISFDSFLPGDERNIQRGVTELESLIGILQQFLVPSIKDRLGVSGFNPGRSTRDKDQYILRRFIAMTFPHNLDRLARSVEQLNESLFRHFPALSREPRRSSPHRT